MIETLFLLLGFFALALCGKLLYMGYSRLCARLAKTGPFFQDANPAAVLLTGFSLCTLFILFIMGYTVAVLHLPLTLGSVLLAGLLILAFDNLLLFVGYHINQQLNSRTLSDHLLRQKQQTEVDYYKALEEQYDHQRVLIHDIRKHLAAIRDLADQEDSPAIGRYVRELEASPALQNKVRICGNHILDVVLCRYREVCQNKGVAFSADVREGSVDFLEQIDITALFGNLLENAVEAAQGAQDPFLELLVGVRPGSSLLITLVNRCAQAPESDGAGGFLTWKPRKERHGLGIKSVRSTVKKYGGTLRQYYDADTQLFHTVILI